VATSPEGWWPHARAALIGLHLFAITAMALPAPAGGLDRRTWAEPTVQAEFASWRARLASVGLQTDAATFEDNLFATMSAFMSARDVVLRPFHPYYAWCGTWQSWRMFIAPHTHPARLEIAVREGGAWRVVYLERSDEAIWRRDTFDQDRMRSAIFRFSWPNYQPSYKRFAGWVARNAAVDFPDADQVRVRFFRSTTRTPEQVRAGAAEEGEWTLVQIQKLGPLRP
jgi:hypothetical protein